MDSKIMSLKIDRLNVKCLSGAKFIRVVPYRGKHWVPTESQKALQFENALSLRYQY